MAVKPRAKPRAKPKPIQVEEKVATNWENLPNEEWFKDMSFKIKMNQSHVKECVQIAIDAEIPTSNKFAFVSACMRYYKEFSKVPTVKEVKAWGLDKPL